MQPIETKDFLTMHTPGIPNIDKVISTYSDKEYLKLDSFSKSFIYKINGFLTEYKWIKDSLNQWSRIYEYTYSSKILKNLVTQKAKILDAGCGVTFFPFYLNSDFDVTCVDQDDYDTIYNNINKTLNTNVKFVRSGLNHISFPDESFDAIYCISVLEHTNNRTEILKEFCRLLKPNGLLVITFDISLNSNSDYLAISALDSSQLISDAALYFKIDYDTEMFKKQLVKNDLYTIKYVTLELKEELLPWPKTNWIGRIKDFVLRRKNYSKVDLTFCTFSGRKK
jgi:2-polyprenyl-3-methyl-5-hydroxy-6-metoxy-1,4-benzoquinol methylase